jgi:hypothetical protein
MSIFRDVTITWRGKDYTVTPSMRLMRTIEMGDISLTDIAVRTSQGRPPVSHIAVVLSKMLQSVGANASEDAVFEELISGDADQVAAMVGVVMTAFTPQIDEGKNPDAQAGKQPQARASKKAAR